MLVGAAVPRQGAEGVFLAGNRLNPAFGMFLIADQHGHLIAAEHKGAVAEGDRVVFGKYGGTEISHEGEDLLILRADDLYAVIG